MKNQEIIDSIKSGSAEGIAALSDKYGIVLEDAERIAESILKHNATRIQKRADRVIPNGSKILVGWHGHGFLGGFDTNTEFCFNGNGDMYAVYGD